jgi:hypothetical protein
MSRQQEQQLENQMNAQPISSHESSVLFLSLRVHNPDNHDIYVTNYYSNTVSVQLQPL